MEGLALTGAWVDKEKGLLSRSSSRWAAARAGCAALRPGEPVVVMGPTGTPTEIPEGETVLLCGGGLGNAVLFSIARALRALGASVLYFAGYKNGARTSSSRTTSRRTPTRSSGAPTRARRSRRAARRTAHFRGNIVQAMVAYGEGELGERAGPARRRAIASSPSAPTA